ncbi:uncharacterized protein PGTG_02248 [Puccinia graminis f. sp. tritici CRL 75-36-700-3]|uniref:Uncharacterized protein n=1 Tax=Puccinia graminis f. sp. tritici (strain CRL 75-36-700-3 / race SCCL) TaxID=418459 RepID=E3JXL2_PUCGT|nr:uncharacterized protein PGTG_02248 [Puccinia graminis f. sp. tritici CRL 75-36-700-3]EFP76787.1 hypothetical protein PGTG_02248 [Puccinia graminis f. sp. tritici CRL 75-36-700-3]
MFHRLQLSTTRSPIGHSSYCITFSRAFGKRPRKSSNARNSSPITINIHNLNYTRLKRLVIEHIREQSQHQYPKYPIDVIAVYAEHESALRWYYAAVPKALPAPVDFVHRALTESSFDAFIKEVEDAPADYRLWIEIHMCSLNKIDRPEAIISVMAPDQEGHLHAATSRRLYEGVALLETSNCLIDDINYVPIKRDSGGSHQSPAKKRIRNDETTSTMLLGEFLALCNIPIDNKHVSEMIDKHEIFDWKVFIGTSLTELTQLGFKWGPARSILAGVAKATESGEPKK